MKLNLIKLLAILEFLNEHYIFTTIFAFIIILPFTFFIFDGFKFSENKLMKSWQNLNILFVLAILLIFFINIITINSIYNSDGSEDKDPHIKVAEKLYEAAKSLGDKLGDGGAASAGVYGAVKMMPKGAPIAVKAGGIAGGAFLGVVGKQAGQAVSSILKSSNSGGGSGNSSQGKVNTNVSNPTSTSAQSSPQPGVNSSLENTEYSGVLMENSDLNNLDYSILSNDTVYSAIFDVNLLSLLYGENKVEVILSAILITNIIKIIMELLLIFSLCSTFISNLEIELKWLLSFKFISESFRLKLVNIIKNVLIFYSKSAKLNIIIVLIVMVLCDVQSIYFVDIFLDHIETMCDYYIKFKSQQ